MSDTPRTDKHVADIGADGLADGDFARQLERDLAAAQGKVEKMTLRLEAIANWRERADAYDADMGYKLKRTYCEDVVLIEDAARLALDAAPVPPLPDEPLTLFHLAGEFGPLAVLKTDYDALRHSAARLQTELASARAGKGK